MKFGGNIIINAPQEKVWTYLTDPNVVSQCAPGLQSMEIVIPDKQFNVVAGVVFGPVKVTFNVKVEWQDREPPNFASVRAHGTAPGSGIDVVSGMRLSGNPDNTTSLAWTADIVVVGSIASMASRMMGGLTKKLSESFFDCIRSKIESSIRVDA